MKPSYLIYSGKKETLVNQRICLTEIKKFSPQKGQGALIYTTQINDFQIMRKQYSSPLKLGWT